MNVTVFVLHFVKTLKKLFAPVTGDNIDVTIRLITQHHHQDITNLDNTREDNRVSSNFARKPFKVLHCE